MFTAAAFIAMAATGHIIGLFATAATVTAIATSFANRAIWMAILSFALYKDVALFF